LWEQKRYDDEIRRRGIPPEMFPRAWLDKRRECEERVFELQRRLGRWGEVQGEMVEAPPPPPMSFDAYWARKIAERPLEAWGGQSRFASNHAFIRWIRDVLGKKGPDRGNKPRTLAWIAEASGQSESSIKTWCTHARLSAADIRKSPSQLARDWQPPD